MKKLKVMTVVGTRPEIIRKTRSNGEAYVMMVGLKKERILQRLEVLETQERYIRVSWRL